jgi:hypothetical protein
MKLKQILLTTSLLAASMNTFAQDIDIKIQNITQGIIYTPFIVAAHDNSAAIFSLGEAASPELQKMAEGGDTSGLRTIFEGMSADITADTGLLMPGADVTLMLNTSEGNSHLAIASMLLPTNDAFAGVSGWEIPTEAGEYVIFLDAYDAGTEANDEQLNAGAGGAPGVAGIPAAPGMNAGTGGTGVASTESNPVVHVHPGNLGDDDLMGGKSDLDNTVHRWLNPVVKVTLTVK